MLSKLFSKTQFPFIRTVDKNYLYTRIVTDTALKRDRSARRKVEEYVSICMGRNMYYTGTSFRDDATHRLL